MNRALIFLISRSLGNAVLARLKRLRQPKYLIGTLIGAAYFYFYFFKILFGRGFGRGDEPAPPPLGFDREVALDVAALAALGMFIAFAWIIPASRAALAFTEAEMIFLLPAPITRAALIRYKLLKSQLGLLLLAALMTLVTGRLAQGGLALIHTLGWWVVFATLQLHRLAASFVFTRALDRGLSTRGRRFIVLGIAAVLAGLLVGWNQAAPAAPPLSGPMAVQLWVPYLHEVVTAGPAPWLLAPFRIVVRPYFAESFGELCIALLPALGLMALHYFWITRSDLALEDASIELSQKTAAMVAAQRAGNFRPGGMPKGKREPLFRLHPIGWRFIAFTWKSFIQAGGRRTVRIGLIVIAVLAAVVWTIDRSSQVTQLALLSTIATTLVFFASFLVGPQATAQNIRRELLAADWLKTMPVPPLQIVLGLLLGPALIVTALQTGAVVIATMNSHSFLAEIPVTIPRLAILPFAALALPALNIVFSLIPTGTMLLFPGWFRPGEQRGLEATGLALITVVAQFALILIALLPPALAFAGIAYGVQFVAPAPLAFCAASLVAMSTLWIEAWLGMLLLSIILGGYDPSRE